MKTLCPKPGKGGKIHPSPAEDPIAAAFRLLPAAILVLVAGLTPEDQRVLAHLVTRSFLVGWDAATAPPPEQARGRRRRGHPPTVGCPCFECYGSFWTRWGCSPHHDRIHAALEAFEEHLNATESAAASSSSAATSPSSKRRDRGKRSKAAAAAAAAAPPPPTPPPPAPMQSRHESPEPPADAEVVPEPSSPPPPSCPPPAACPSENKENVPEAAPAEAKAEECGGEVAAEAEEERKRGWADVMGGVLNPRRWGIWSPAVESAT